MFERLISLIGKDRFEKLADAKVLINSGKYLVNKTTEFVKIDAKSTKAYVYVQAEDGTVKKYIVNINGLPDNAYCTSCKCYAFQYGCGIFGCPGVYVFSS